MLNNISSFLKNLGTKSLIVLIALSFAVWGIGDIFIDNKNPKIADVGNTEIKLKEFNIEYQSILQQLRQSTSEPITDDFVKAMGLHNNVLQNLITRKYINILSKDLGIDVSNKYLKKSIFNNPMFKDQLGVFNKDYFNYYLTQNNLSEKELISINKDMLINNLLLKAISVDNYLPLPLKQNIIKKRDTVRKAIVYDFDASSFLFKEKVNDSIIREKYELLKDTLLTPEQRDITLIKINVDELKKNFSVSEKEIKDFYLSNIDFYQEEEKRTFYQPLFKTEKEAMDFENEFRKGGSILTTLKSFNINEKDIILKDIEKAEIEEAIKEEVFSLKKGQLSKIYKTAFGFKLLYLEDIKLTKKKEFDEVKNEIINDFKKEDLNDKIYNTANDIYEKFLETNNLNSALKNREVIKKEFKNIDLNSIKKIISEGDIKADEAEISKIVFNLEKDKLSESLEDENSNIFFVYCNNIIEQKNKSFNTARDEVLEIIFKEKRDMLAKIEAEKYLTIIKDDQARTYKNEIFRSYETDWVTFDDRIKSKLNRNLKQVIFNGELNSFSDVYKVDSSRYVFVKIINQSHTYLDKDKLTTPNQIRDEYSISIDNDIFNAVIYDLKKMYDNKINENFIKSF